MKRASGKSNLSVIRDYVDGVRPFTQISMSGTEDLSSRKDGEVWEDGTGKKWKKSGGRKVAQDKKSTIINEERCMCCKADTRWGSRLDKSVWPKTQKCYDCFIEFETILKTKGVFETYKRVRDLKNLNGYLKNLKSKLEQTISWCSSDTNKNIQFFNDIIGAEQEVWNDNTDAIEKIKNDANTDLQLVNDRLVDVSKELTTLSNNDMVIKDTEKELKIKYKNGRDSSFGSIEVLNKV